jgi:hypothetical protein
MAIRKITDIAFSGRTLEEGLAWCLVWLMAPELGLGRFWSAPSITVYLAVVASALGLEPFSQFREEARGRPLELSTPCQPFAAENTRAFQ